MIVTKLLSLSSGLTKSKALKIVILLIEIGVLLYAIAEAEKDENETIELEDYN